ncbi:MAG TPA: hypothetical protein VFE14_16265 [Micromonosporaceae bacterium]|jgi:hypothetical protein|nr:hypothetical protein [Micromonosporaceae bacterium]
MTRRQKVVVVAVLVAMVLLFAGALGNGGGSGEGDAGGGHGGFIEWLGGVAGKPPPVERADLKSGCLAGDTLTVKGVCTLTVARSGKDVRQLVLHVQQAVSLDSRAPKGDKTATADVKAGDDIKITVDGDGGDITLHCGDPAGTCVVTLK